MLSKFMVISGHSFMKQHIAKQLISKLYVHVLYILENLVR